MFRKIVRELGRHIPFTALGSVTGIVVMVITLRLSLSEKTLHGLFETMHPAHVFLSAIVSAAMFRRYRKNLLIGVIVGMVASVGIGTLSDIILPYLGGLLMGAQMEFHLAFIHEWYLVNTAALAGVAVGLWRPVTRVPHAGHILISTWASLFYLIGYGHGSWPWPAVFVVLVFAVWIPCCTSDIIFPLFFVGKEGREEALAHLHH